MAKLVKDTRKNVIFQLNGDLLKAAIKKAGGRKRINKHAQLIYTTSLKHDEQ
jgi:hypothetical protein